MPALRVGDLVWYKSFGEPEDWDAVGLILEMRHMAPRPPDARVLWNDMPDPRWTFISDLVPMQPDGKRGITGW